MSIKITQPFSFDSKRPNFERDVIDSSSLFVSNDPLNLNSTEKMNLAANYDVGHIVWDTHTSKYYGVVQSSTGVNECVLVELDFTDTTLSGIAYCISGAATTVKVGIMPGFALANGQSILLYLHTSNTAVSATLDVNSTGAKPVVIGGSATTATNFKSGLWLCRYDGTNWNCEPTQVQANWNETNATSPSFIQNKPTIPTIRTINHETIIGYTDVNIHDGYYFPNAVTDLDGNWYGAVVIGEQVWLGENMKTKIYPSSGEGILNGGFDDTDVGYFFPMLDELGGFYYNWTATMDGYSDSNDAPSGIRGIAPTGFHIPSKTEFDNLLEYLETQERYNDSITKSLAATSGWTTNQLPGDQSWPAVEIEKNNATGFNSRQGGYYLGGVLYEDKSAFYWTTTIGQFGNPFYFEIPNNDSSIKIDEAHGTNTFCAVRCVSDLNPVQFRDWYVNTYGTMQHHLDRNGILNTTSTTSQATSSNESLSGTVRLHKVSKTGSYNDLLDTPDLSTSLYEEITYSSLRTKIGNSQLVKGKMYRITDYETTTTQQGTYAAGNPFDLVVTAISANELDCRASALPRKNDTYYNTAKADLTKWLVLYDIENDISKYAWTDEHNGKGVIYRLVDENGNDCPYDFKNILFLNANNYDKVYTFNYIDGNNDNRDLSLRKPVCHNNVIKPYLIDNQMSLNFNVFLNSSVGSLCSDNKIGSDSHDNKFNDSNSDIVIGDCCSYNTFGIKTTNVHFKDRCENNCLENYCNKVFFGENCNSNGLSVYSQNIEFGISCQNIMLSSRYNNNIRIGNNNNHIRLYNNTSPSSSNWLENVYIVQGFHTSSQSYVDITTIDRGLAYRTTVGRKSDGTVKIYNEEDCIADYALMATQVEHQLHIGPHDYDGSAEVTVDVFEDSDYYFSSDFGYVSDLFVCNILTKTYNNGTNIVTLDHTPVEIGNALESGKLPIVIDSQGGIGVVGIYYFMDLRHGTSNNVDYVFKRFCDDDYSFAISTLKYGGSNGSHQWVETTDAIAEPYSRIYTNNNNFHNQIDVSEISGYYSTFRTKKVVCTNDSSSALVLQITGFQTPTNTIYVKNQTDLTVSSGQTKMITLTYIENQGLFVESYVPTTVQALGD